MLWLPVAVVIAACVWGIFVYNRLVRSRNQVLAGWSDVDVQLQRRHDLIPQLVTAVRAYADYEQATLKAVTELRLRSQQAPALQDKARIEDEIDRGVQRLIALAEAYPDLKASENFGKLQSELSDTEDKLQYARRYYNGSVRMLNTRIESFPDTLVAGPFGFRPAEFFDADGAASAAPRVSL